MEDFFASANSRNKHQSNEEDNLIHDKMSQLESGMKRSLCDVKMGQSVRQSHTPSGVATPDCAVQVVASATHGLMVGAPTVLW